MKDQAVVFILFGQSNAVGHILPMAEEDKIKVPLKNIFGLSRAANQSYDNTSLTWEGYRSAGMNLAEEQDDTYSLANCLARQWQNAVDAGQDLPDLYIVHIAIGAQGVTENYMWYPDRAPKIVPGPLGVVDISLHPLATHILSLVCDYMAATGKDARYVLHWRGGEEEMDVPMEKLGNLQEIYERLIGDWRTAVGQNMPVVLHRIVAYQHAIDWAPNGVALERTHYINGVFDALTVCNEHVSVFDPSTYPVYGADALHSGIFLEDDVHFTRDANEWIAAQIMESIR